MSPNSESTERDHDRRLWWQKLADGIAAALCMVLESLRRLMIAAWHYFHWW